MKNLKLIIAIFIFNFFALGSTVAQWSYSSITEAVLNSNVTSLGIGVSNPSNSYKVHIDGGTENSKHGMYIVGQNNKRAIYARSNTNTAVYAVTTSGKGVYGSASTGNAIEGRSWTGRSVYGYTSTGYGVYGRAATSTGFAGYFDGKVEVDGKVMIGTSNAPLSIGGDNISNYKLFVQGGLLADEVRVRNNWADYVFAKDYALKPLSQVQQFIEEKGHLPNVPSEEEVESQGLHLGEMTKIQQEKIEELFLYVIQLDEKTSALEAENKLLKEKVELLEKKNQK